MMMIMMMFPAYIFQSNQSVMAGSVRPAGGEVKRTCLSLVLMSLCQRQDCAYRWRARTRHIVLWCGKLDRTRAEKKGKMSMKTNITIRILLIRKYFSYEVV